MVNRGRYSVYKPSTRDESGTIVRAGAPPIVVYCNSEMQSTVIVRPGQRSVAADRPPISRFCICENRGTKCL